MKKAVKTAFVSDLLQWNSTQNNRKMPWKGEKNPYRIWLSEIILQQTRVDQGLSYYQTFIKKYPTVHHLAKTSDADVFKSWEGLGYYNRCRNLLFTARFISKELNGVFPKEYSEIIKLKGIGPYTAAAISSFAYNECRAVVDGNVFRVLSRYFGIETPIDSSKGKIEFSLLANELLQKETPAAYNQAIMDMGAVVCKPKPDCEICPLQKNCFAYNNGMQNDFPVKEKKLVRITRYFQFIIAEAEGKILVRERKEKDIWRNLHEFILFESNNKLSPENFISSQEFKKIAGSKYTIANSTEDKQQLTHQIIHGLFLHIKIKKLPSLNNYQVISIRDLHNLAFPKMMQKQLRLISEKII